MSGEHELPTASVVRSSQATPARRPGQLCTDVRPAGLHLSKPVRCSDNRNHLCWWYARKVPRWIDEGVAVVVANEPRHSEDNWREIQRQALPIPPLNELVSFKDWGVAVNKYGETAGDVPSNLHVVYTAAGHEVRTFLACSGPTGVAAVLAAVQGGSSFDAAYVKVAGTCAPKSIVPAR